MVWQSGVGLKPDELPGMHMYSIGSRQRRLDDLRLRARNDCRDCGPCSQNFAVVKRKQRRDLAGGWARDRQPSEVDAGLIEIMVDGCELRSNRCGTCLN